MNRSRPWDGMTRSKFKAGTGTPAVAESAGEHSFRREQTPVLKPPVVPYRHKEQGYLVIPAQAGIQIATLDSRLRGNDETPESRFDEAVAIDPGYLTESGLRVLCRLLCDLMLKPDHDGVRSNCDLSVLVQVSQPLHLVSSGLLCSVEQSVGFREKADSITGLLTARKTGSICIRIVTDDTHADSDRNDLIFKEYRLCRYSLANPLRSLYRFCQTCTTENDSKLLAAVTSQRITASQETARSSRKLHKHRITGKVSVLIIDRFESIEVHHQKTQWRVCLTRLLKVTFKCFHQVSTVEGGCQAIGGHDPEDDLVILRFQSVGAQELEDLISETDSITGLQFVSSVDPDFVDVGSVGASRIRHQIAAIQTLDQGMTPGYGIIRKDESTLVITPD